MSELYIPPERFERDFITGRFLKGCVSRNKGRKMVYHSKRSKARSIKNLSKGRGAWHKTGAGMNKKSVVLIKDEKLCGVFPSIQMAGKMIGVAPSLISAICRKVRGKHTANGYRRFFFQKQLQQEAKAYAKEHGKTGLFAVGRFGPLTQRGFSQHLKAWGKHCGIDPRKMHAHAFRHFFAKMFLKKNKDVIQLADLLGHGSVDTTGIYLQKSYDGQKKDFNRNVTW